MKLPQLLVAALMLLAPITARAATAITGQGTISQPGDYYLANDITVSSGIGLIVTAANVKIDTAGKTLRSTEAGNAPTSFGILANNATGGLYLYDSSNDPGPDITGFRFGIISSAPNTTLERLNLSGNKYIGANLTGANAKVREVTIDGLGGVTDQAYAIGINAGGLNASVTYSVFRNLYRQAGAPAGMAGEGLCVNLTSSGVGGYAAYNLCENDNAETHTIGMYGGTGGANLIEYNVIRRFAYAVQGGGAAAAPLTVRRNIMFAGPVQNAGVSANYGFADDNDFIGWAAPFGGTIPQGVNRFH